MSEVVDGVRYVDSSCRVCGKAVSVWEGASAQGVLLCGECATRSLKTLGERSAVQGPSGGNEAPAATPPAIRKDAGPLRSPSALGEDVSASSTHSGDSRPVTTGSSPTPVTVSFVVPGIAAPQGSKTRTTWGMREDNPNTKPWRNAVAEYARDAMGDRPLLPSPLELSARFWFPRPQGHYRTGKHAGELKPNAPTWCDKVADLDKLVRAIGDACKGIVYRDDVELVRLTEVEKLYGSPRAEITIRALGAREGGPS